MANFTAAALGFSPLGLGLNTRCLSRPRRRSALPEALRKPSRAESSGGCSCSSEPAARDCLYLLRDLLNFSSAFCSCAYHRDKSCFRCLFCLLGLVCPVGSGVAAVPRRGSGLPAAAAPDSAGKRREGKGGAGRAGPAGKPWGAGKARRKGPRKGSERKGGSWSPPNAPPGPLLAFPSAGSRRSRPRSCGCRRKEPALKCRSRASQKK